jgi:hypothetical protein
MNYKKIYNALIERAQNRTIDGYTEKHHIIPRCMDGTDDKENLVYLTPEEHYVAHQLLVKMHPEVDKLVFALVVMSGKNPTTNKLFGWHRRKLSETQRRLHLGMKLGPQSEEHRKAIGDANRGEKNGMFGTKWTEEQRAHFAKRVPWNRGKTKETDPKVAANTAPSEKRKGKIPWNKGKKTGPSWNKGLTKETDARVAAYGQSHIANKSKTD